MRCKDPLDSQEVDDRSECERSCNENPNCQFIFYDEYSKACILYDTCKEIIIGDLPGNTYSKIECTSS